MKEELKCPHEANDTRIVDLGLDAKYKDMIDSVFGQMSDGWWENTPAMEGYWRFAKTDVANGKVRLVIDTLPSYADPLTGKHHVSNRWLDMNDAAVRQFLADKIKFLMKGEGLKWDRGNDAETEYLSYDELYSVKDCYFAYEVLKGRNTAKHPEYITMSESVYLVTYKTAKGNSAENEVDGDFLDFVLDDLKSKGCTDIKARQIESKSEERISYDELKKKALARLDNATYADEDDLEESILATLDAMPYDIAEGVKEALASEIFNELLDKAEESKKCESDDDGWADWEDVEGLQGAIEAIEDLAYELRSLVRGSRTGRKTWKDLGDYIVKLANNLSEAGEDMKYKTDESVQDPKAEAARLTELINANPSLSAQAENICYQDRKKRGGDFDFIESIHVMPKWRDESKFVLWYGDGSADHRVKGYRVVAQGDSVKFVKDPSI